MKFIVICIVVVVVANIVVRITNSIDKKTIAERMTSDPELALKIAVDSSFSPEEFEEQVLSIIQNTGYDKAMEKLARFYASEEADEKKDIEKSNFWLERAAKAGNLKSILDYYGFSGYDVKSDEYEEILCCLDKVKFESEDEAHMMCYQKSIVYYKMGKPDMAGQILESLDDPELDEKRYHMLFMCLTRMGNMDKAEQVLLHMENNDWVVPAEFYFGMYQYHKSSKANKEPDYAAQVKYTEKYERCDDIDEDKVSAMGGDAYCHLGEKYWREGMTHDYEMANRYLIKAAEKGVVRAKEILEKYGVEGILVCPMRFDQIKYQFMNGCELDSTENTMKWLQLYYGIQFAVDLLSHDFKERYTNNFRAFDDLINGVYQLYADQIAQMVRWCILLLMSFGIDSYDAEDIINNCEDLSLLSQVPIFEQAIAEVDNRANELHIETAYTKATRTKWSGAGFGSTIPAAIGATIKASAAAGIMNAGSRALHGIGDSIARSIDNAEIRGMERKILESQKIQDEFVDATAWACRDVGETVIEMIEAHSDIKLEVLEGSVWYEGENLLDLDDRTLDAKINNYSYVGDDCVYILLLEKLRRNPLDKKVFYRLYEYADKCEDKNVYVSFKRYGHDFGLLE
ncbi:MAG: hypothetical protein K2H37_05680 [Lachnospiraceae bacterium]|nr:hypothetical protein [Lachnospiraceae bacterium]